MWTRVLVFAHMLEPVCVSVCVFGANIVIAGGNQIGYDLGWQVLRAIVITPVSVNHISLCVLSCTLPT